MPGKRKRGATSRRVRRKLAYSGKSRKFVRRRRVRRAVKSAKLTVETKKYEPISPVTGNDSEGQPVVTDWTNTGIQVSNLNNNQKYTFGLPMCFMKMHRAEDVARVDTYNARVAARECLEGDELFCKYVAMKFELTYPGGDKAPHGPSRPVKLIWGFVQSLNLTDDPAANYGIHKNQVTYDQIGNHVDRWVKKLYDDLDDELIFQDHEDKTFTIVGRHTFLPQDADSNVPHQVVQGSSFPTTVGASPLQKTVKWPMMKKVKYTTTSGNASVSSPSNFNPATGQFAYPNNSLVPFWIIINEDFHKYNSTTDFPHCVQPRVRVSSCMWYLDQ